MSDAAKHITVQQKVKAFHDKMGVSETTVSDTAAIQQRINLIKEESKELVEALESGNPEAILKECCDLVYVAVGTSVRFRMQFDAAFKRVHASNMAKVWTDGKIHFREDGKVLKPPSYSPPRMDDLV